MFLYNFLLFFFFFFNDTATTEIYTFPYTTLFRSGSVSADLVARARAVKTVADAATIVTAADRKSTRLNSSHSQISYAVFCLKKKKEDNYTEISLHSRTLYFVYICVLCH